MRRREFISASTTSAGGLLLGVSLLDRLWIQGAAAPFSPNAFLRIDPLGPVTFVAPVPELGTGVRTSLCMIVAEELGIDPAAMRLEQADSDEDKYGPHQRTAGSQTVREYWLPMRRAGAAAREMLIAAAAARWGVSAAECHAAGGQVTHPPSRRRASFGGLARAASALPVPFDPPLKDPKQFITVGKAMPSLDIPAIVNGTIQFGLDVERTGMLRAVMTRCPVFGGRALRVDDSAARGIPGVVDVLVVEPKGALGRPFMQGGVAVLATSTWAALKARTALRIEWDNGPNAAENTAAVRERAASRARNPAKVVKSRGDPYVGLSAAAVKLSAEYEVPFLAHAPLEPMNCVAEVRDGSCELWAPAQIPHAAKQLAARATGLAESNIVVHVMRMGGGFGRRLGADYAAEAAWLSQQTGKPVQIVWSREDDMRNGFFRPFGRHYLEAGLDTQGNVTGWIHRVASTSRVAFRPTEDPANSEVNADDFPTNVLPHVSVEFANVESTVQRGPWRAPRDNANGFVIESFLDEVAHHAGRDPLEYRLALLGPDRTLPSREGAARSVSTGRLRGVLQAAGRKAGWGIPLPAGRARGIAAFFAYSSYVAHVAEVSVDRVSGRLTVHRVTSAIDCGTIVNPSGVRAQVEGAIIDALSSLYREITFENGVVQQSTFANYRMLRIDEAPPIDVVLIDSDEPPTGAGEPPFPAVAPAVLNAVFAATGVRIRRLPLRTGDLKA